MLVAGWEAERDERRSEALGEFSSCEWKELGFALKPVALYERHVESHEGGRCVVARPTCVTHRLVARAAALRCMGSAAVLVTILPIDRDQ